MMMNIYTTQRRCVLGSKNLRQLSEKKKKKIENQTGGSINYYRQVTTDRLIYKVRRRSGWRRKFL
jgi:hypothetical protein